MINYFRKNMIKIILDNKLLKCDGYEFQKFINQIYTYKDDKFTPVKPQGQIGDRKNDGYIHSSGTYLQVFGPEDLNNSETQKYAIQKYKEDFRILFNYIKNGVWPPIKKFIYVINDKGYGFFPDLLNIKDNLASTYKCVEFDIYGYNNIYKDMLDLSNDQQENLLGPILECEETVDIVDNYVLDEVIKSIIDNYEFPYTKDNFSSSTPPEFENKIVFNNLKNKPSEIKLKEGYFNIDNIEKIINQDTNSLIGEALSEIMKNTYKEAKHRYDNNQDFQFFYLFNELLDKVKTNRNVSDMCKHNAIFCIMSKYFECCDIFEEPPKESKAEN